MTSRTDRRVPDVAKETEGEASTIHRFLPYRQVAMGASHIIAGSMRGEYTTGCFALPPPKNGEVRQTPRRLSSGIAGPGTALRPRSHSDHGSRGPAVAASAPAI
jgi:hypothetical protein